MSVLPDRLPANRVVLHDVSWQTCESLLKDFDRVGSPRIAFDQGVMEIVSPFAEHERLNWLLASIVQIVLEEMDLDFENLGHATFKRDSLKRGFEPDSCFYIRNAGSVRDKRRIDLKTDPPPELIIEIDLTSDSMNKLPIYAALGVREVWRYGRSLEIMSLIRWQPLRKASLKRRFANAHNKVHQRTSRCKPIDEASRLVAPDTRLDSEAEMTQVGFAVDLKIHQS